MRIITVLLILLIAALQWPMWLGRGGWYRVWQIESTLAQQRVTNAALTARNAALAAEVADLKTGKDAMEERARSELGMIKKDEVFFHILENNTKTRTTNSAPTATLRQLPSEEGE